MVEFGTDIAHRVQGKRRGLTGFSRVWTSVRLRARSHSRGAVISWAVHVLRDMSIHCGVARTCRNRHGSSRRAQDAPDFAGANCPYIGDE